LVHNCDLHARHRWLVETARERVQQCKTDPDFYDAKVAGWWVWGQCLWIGSGWCARPEWTGRMPAIAGRDGGRGAHAKSRNVNPRAGDTLNNEHRRLDLGSDGDGNGIIRTQRKSDPDWEQRPHLGSDGQGQGIIRKRPMLTHHGGNVGVHKPSLAMAIKRPVLAHSEGGRGVMRQAHQVPSLRGDSGAAGQGIHAPGFQRRSQQIPVLGCAHGSGQGVSAHAIHRSSGGLQAYMRALSDRLRRVRVCCGDFERILGPAVTTCIGMTGVFLDPPYDTDARAICYSHDGEEADTGKSVWWRAYRWAVEHGEDPLLRIALCGYEHPDAIFPESWECIPWKASGGYGRSARGKANARRERIWFSPGCLKPARLPLFDESALPLTSAVQGGGTGVSAAGSARSRLRGPPAPSPNDDLKQAAHEAAELLADPEAGEVERLNAADALRRAAGLPAEREDDDDEPYDDGEPDFTADPLDEEF
jgi:hypothetical protein